MERCQLPLKIYWGITIQIPQGLAISNAYQILLGPPEKVADLSYVVLLRVGKIFEWILEPATPYSLNLILQTKNIHYR